MHLFAVFCIGALLLTSCGRGIAVGEDAKVELNVQLAELLNAEAHERLDVAASSYCLQEGDAECELVRVPQDLPACPIWSDIADCLAIEVRNSMLALPAARQLIERDTATLCTYVVGPPQPSGTTTATVLGCVSPLRQARLHYRAEPTLCVLTLDDQGQRVASFAVHNGRRVRHQWCGKMH